MNRAWALAMYMTTMPLIAAYADDTLPNEEDSVLVRAHCSGCHSLSLVTQQCATEEQWLDLIRWMQAKQNLWQFEPEIEARIIAYLARHFGPRDRQRRAALTADQLPPNPYAPEKKP